MGKKHETALATAPSGGGELAKPGEFARPFQMEGEDSGDFLMPRVVIHQGDISEKFYGQHPKGTVLDSATGEVLIDAKTAQRSFLCVGIAWKQYTRFGEGRGDPIQYSTRNRAEVPPEDLVWHDREPPKCDVTRNFVILFDGAESPVCLVLRESSKSQRNAGKSLNQMEKLRQKRGPGLYKLSIVDVENDKGKWKDVKITPSGDPPAALARAGLEFFNSLSGRDVVVQEENNGGESAAYDPENDG